MARWSLWMQFTLCGMEIYVFDFSLLQEHLFYDYSAVIGAVQQNCVRDQPITVVIFRKIQ